MGSHTPGGWLITPDSFLREGKLSSLTEKVYSGFRGASPACSVSAKSYHSWTQSRNALFTIMVLHSVASDEEFWFYSNGIMHVELTTCPADPEAAGLTELWNGLQILL